MNQWTGYPPLPMSRRQMASYICAWIPVTSMRPSAMITTGCPPWRKLLTSLHTLASSLSWMPTMDTGQLFSTRTPACLQLSTVLLEDTISYDFPLAWSVPKTSSRKRWIRSLKNAKDVSEFQMTSPSTAALEAEHNACLRDLMQTAHKYDLVFNPQKTHMNAQAVNFFGCLYNANGVHPDPGKVNTVHALPAPTKGHILVTYLSPFIPGLSTLTAPL